MRRIFAKLFSKKRTNTGVKNQPVWVSFFVLLLRKVNPSGELAEHAWFAKQIQPHTMCACQCALFVKKGRGILSTKFMLCIDALFMSERRIFVFRKVRVMYVLRFSRAWQFWLSYTCKQSGFDLRHSPGVPLVSCKGRERGYTTRWRLLRGPGGNGTRTSIKCLRSDLKIVRGAAASFYPCYTETSQK